MLDTGWNPANGGVGYWMESRQPRFLRDQSRQAAARRGWMKMRAPDFRVFIVALPSVNYTLRQGNGAVI